MANVLLRSVATGKRRVRTSGIQRIVESGTFAWPWQSRRGLAVVTGGSGGGGGGGGAFCMHGLNLHGGGGGHGGEESTLVVGPKTYAAGGGRGGDGGGGGGMQNGQPAPGRPGIGSGFGGGEGGRGAHVEPRSDGVVAEGGDGGRGFAGETLVVELEGLSPGDPFEITIGHGGGGGNGGPASWPRSSARVGCNG